VDRRRIPLAHFPGQQVTGLMGELTPEGLVEATAGAEVRSYAVPPRGHLRHTLDGRVRVGPDVRPEDKLAAAVPPPAVDIAHVTVDVRDGATRRFVVRQLLLGVLTATRTPKLIDCRWRPERGAWLALGADLPFVCSADKRRADLLVPGIDKVSVHHEHVALELAWWAAVDGGWITPVAAP
jgi:hypothetical protein